MNATIRIAPRQVGHASGSTSNYNGWDDAYFAYGGGWRARSRPYVQITNVYVSPRYRNVYVNRNVTAAGAMREEVKAGMTDVASHAMVGTMAETMAETVDATTATIAIAAFRMAVISGVRHSHATIVPPQRLTATAAAHRIAKRSRIRVPTQGQRPPLPIVVATNRPTVPLT